MFASSQETVTYQEVEINSYENRIINQWKIYNTHFYDGFPYCYNKIGKKMKSPDKDTKLTSLLLKYSIGSSYELAFHHPTHWDSGNKQVKDNNFIPLLLNNDDEIIAFYHAHSKGAVLVFPCIKDKRSFLLELFNNYLSEIFSEPIPLSLLDDN